jgi:23S rRNA (cytosine1962-C5)-methyltransferase
MMAGKTTRGVPQLTLLASPWEEYELLDSGDGQKLERFGQYRLVRPEVEALWQPALPEAAWKDANASFVTRDELHGGHWVINDLPKRWLLSYRGLKMWMQASGSRQVGVFPEQSAHWDWIEEQIKKAKRPLRVLNLFGYTGLASLAAARSGAQVTHVDASRKVVEWGKENQVSSGLADQSIRWLVDDAIKFVQRESRRDSFYDGIILDPPKFGRGPKGEVWEFYKLIPELLDACKRILSPQPVFVVMTAYAVKASSVTLFQAMDEMMAAHTGRVMAGELVLQEKSAGRYLPTAIYARWAAKFKA